MKRSLVLGLSALLAVSASVARAQPALRHFGVEATVRPSLAFYNTHAEVDALGRCVARPAS